jgi:hypothetical protein
MILNLFFRFFALWVVFHTSLSSAARNHINPKAKLEGRPADVELLHENTMAWSRAGREFPSNVLMGVLKDQLDISKPEKGAVYIFTQFLRGTIWEDLWNGGKQ